MNLFGEFSPLCGVLAPKVDKLVPPQCAASADRFPVKRLTRAAPAAAADRVPSFSVSKALLVRRVAYCFDLGRCSSKKKVNGLEAISSKEARAVQ